MNDDDVGINMQFPADHSKSGWAKDRWATRLHLLREETTKWIEQRAKQWVCVVIKPRIIIITVIGPDSHVTQIRSEARQAQTSLGIVVEHR